MVKKKMLQKLVYYTTFILIIMGVFMLCMGIYDINKDSILKNIDIFTVGMNYFIFGIIVTILSVFAFGVEHFKR